MVLGSIVLLPSSMGTVPLPGFWLWVLRFGIQGSGFRIGGLGLRIQCPGSRIQGLVRLTERGRSRNGEGRASMSALRTWLRIVSVEPPHLYHSSPDSSELQCKPMGDLIPLCGLVGGSVPRSGEHASISAHIRQSWPDSGLDCQVKLLSNFKLSGKIHLKLSGKIP